MPSRLNPQQFGEQTELPGMPPSISRAQESFDPGPDYKRGVVGVGQRQMNFDLPGEDLEVGAGGLVGVDDYTDPEWDDQAWKIGGMLREGGSQLARTWEEAPVRTFGPDEEIRTNQVQMEAYGNEVDVQSDKVAALRSEEFFIRDDEDYSEDDPNDLDPEVRPWVARVGGRNYLLEGHHRTVAQRTRGTGEMDAHVLEADDWGGMFEKFDRQRGRRPRPEHLNFYY